MAAVLASERVQLAGQFHDVARSTANVPCKTYQQLLELVASVGLEPWQVIDFTEEEWNVPSPGKVKPGGNRHQMSGSVLMNIVKHLQLSCAGACGVSFEGMNAREMNDVHLTYRDLWTRGCKYPAAWMYCKESSGALFTEYIKCESKCEACHNQDEMGGGV